MKISKLFHWLYGLLMLLPIFAVLFTCCYVVFNDNAFHSYESNMIGKFTKVTTSNNLLIENRDYQISITRNFINGTDYVYFNEIDPNFINTFDSNYTYVAFKFSPSTDLVLKDSNGIDHSYYNYFVSNNAIKQWTFNFKSISNPNPLITQTDLYLIDYHKESLNHVFYASIELVEDSNIFNWAYNSFIGQPITYISGLFGIPSDSVVNLLLSYWTAISVIWLVFDLILYVPLLAHRWLDKGRLD